MQTQLEKGREFSVLVEQEGKDYETVLYLIEREKCKIMIDALEDRKSRFGVVGMEIAGRIGMLCATHGIATRRLAVPRVDEHTHSTGLANFAVFMINSRDNYCPLAKPPNI